MSKLMDLWQETWKGIDRFQKYSLIAILGLAGLLILMMMGYGIRDVAIDLMR